MLRRFVLAVLVVALAAGFMPPSEAMSAGMDCDQMSLQIPAGGCGGECVAAGACVAGCHAGACIATTVLQPQAIATAGTPMPQAVAQGSDGAHAPDTTPPKHSIA